MTESDEEEVMERVDTALRVLERRATAPVGWSSGDVVRRMAVRRRRVRAFGAGIVVLALVATAVAVWPGGSSGPGRPNPGAPRALPTTPGVRTGATLDGAVQLVANNAPLATTDRAAVAPVVQSEQALSIALLKQVGRGSGNVSVSPASLYLALGMLQNGARGETQRQIAGALQASGLSTDEQNAGLAGLSTALATAAAHDGITLQSANSLWQQRGFALRPEFLAALATYFRTGVWQVDFTHDMPAALNAIDAWTKQQTHGKITKLFDQLDPLTVLVLANAIYFHAAWATPFDSADTEQGSFTTGSGTHVTAEFMSGGRGLKTARSGDYEAVQLPYQGGRFAALAVMPTKGSLSSFVAALSPAKLRSIAAATRSESASVSIPRFTTTSTTDLVPTLKSLGMRTAFTKEADLSGLSDVPTRVDQIVQRVYLGVGEEGTTAAAVTGISIVADSARARPDIQFDHPFLFLVRDTQTGAVLFASEIQDPAG